MEHMDKSLDAVLKELQGKRAATGPKSPSTDQDGNDPEKHKEWLRQRGIAERYIDVTMEAIEEKGLPEHNESIKKNWWKVRRYVLHLPEHIKAGNGLILAGGFGTMKTTMAVAVLRHYLDAGGRGMMIPMCSLIDKLYTLRARDMAEAMGFEDRIRTTRLLVIDDLGTENNQQAWIMSKVDSIISDRHDGRLPTIITTNYNDGDLVQTYGGRLLDRLKNNSFYLPFFGRSERKPLDINDI